jgi:hypothetical protein
MTLVWRTRGPAYHAREHCPAIADGQAEARRKGLMTYRPVQIELARLQSEQTPPRPCMVCWPHESGWTSWLPVTLATEQHSGATDGSPFEVRFLEDVLMKADGVKPTWVSVQPGVERRVGAPLRPDFVIQPPDQRPIVIEVDGYRKSSQPGPDDQGARNRRDAELESLGYRVQHFSNKQVIHEAEWCRRRIGELLVSGHAPAEEPKPTIVTPERPVAAPLPASVSPAAAAQQEISSSSGKRGWWIAVGAVVAAAVAWAAMSSGFDDTADDPTAPTSSGECPDDAPIKGNVSESGEKIFHAPGWEFYSRTGAEECFSTPADAEAAGYRASERR